MTPEKYGLRQPLLAVVFALLPWSAQALLATCDVTSTPAAFGQFDALGGAALDTTGSITVSCSGTAGLLVNYSIALSAGNGSYSTRQLKTAGNNALNYNLYTTTAHTTVWGDGTGSTATVANSFTLILASSVQRIHTVYGRIAGSQQTAPVGSYSDTIAVTLTYN